MFSSGWSKKMRVDGRRLLVETLEDRRVMSATALTGIPLPVVQPATIQTSASLLSTEEWVHSLTYTQFNLLTPDQVQYLTVQQVATIPNTGYFGGISNESRAAFSAAQVRALYPNHVSVFVRTSTDEVYQRGYQFIRKSWDEAR